MPQVEVCDHKDNDCDSVADNGFDLQHDPRNCGSCGNTCNRINSFGVCEAGNCSFTCLPGFYDIDGSPANGCEYACIPTNGGVEVCDGLDNDCDKQIDEGFNLDSDPNNCGSCQHQCLALHATATCVAGKCGYDRVKGCDPPYVDINDQILGCEYLCQTSPPMPTELCDNIDNDCDGQVDEGAPGGGVKCGPTGGQCQQGTTQCVAGHIICVGATIPQAEVCDSLDNDCDGQTDEGFDKTGDPRHCGPDCAICDIPFAVAKCIPGTTGTGECAIAACLPGHVDRDHNIANGCEYGCTLTGSEVCDGFDNDCNGTTDDGLTPPTGLCANVGACANTVPVCAKGATGCDEGTRWRCPYPAAVETDACGNLRPQELLCDELDGDCDGITDDAFSNKNAFCSDGKIGICAGTGTFTCSADKTMTVCTITHPGQPPSTTGDTTCDGRDDDCDGMLDEDALGEMVTIGAFKIDRFEASRPDATDTSEGVLSYRACSEANRLPWRSITQPDADALCAASGKRLCTEAEWQSACAGGSNRTYPYGSSYDPGACNGADYTPGPNDILLPTGGLPTCATPTTSIMDLSGNLKEWTSTPVTGGQFRIRGGAFDSISTGLTCQFNFVSADTDYLFENLGFRCCKSVP